MSCLKYVNLISSSTFALGYLSIDAPTCWLTNWRRRLSRSAQQTLQTTRTIPAALWEKEPISSEGWTRQNGSFFGQRMIARRQ